MLAQAVMETEVTGLVGAILREQDGEQAVDERRCFSAEARKRLLTPALAAVEQDLLMASA